MPRGLGFSEGARVMNGPVTLPSKAEAIHDRPWWAAESARVGSDWQTIGQIAARVLTHLMPCPTCEHTPCRTPTFCEVCREADHEERTSAMPETFDNTNRGVLFNERDKKQTDKDRDYGGSINVGGGLGPDQQERAQIPLALGQAGRGGVTGGSGRER